MVGGGTAGLEAAAEASTRGAEVTVVEKSESPEPPWRLWPDEIRHSRAGPGGVRPTWFDGRWKPAKLLTRATRSGPGLVDTESGSVRSDFVILATGSRFEPAPIEGRRKKGVVVLDSARAYSDLGRLSGQASRVVVTGEGVRCLEVADRLAGGGKTVDVVISDWRPAPPSSATSEVLYEAAKERGVGIRSGSVTRALGAGELEAALVDGAVTRCDALVVVPRRVPNVVPSRLRLGPAGGVLVDGGLRTGDPSTFAVGGCAEPARAAPPRTFSEEPSMTGRVAASNCLGDGLRPGTPGRWGRVIFGLRWTRYGAFPPSGPPGPGRPGIAKRWDRRTACAIAFEGATGRILAVEAAEDADSRSSVAFPTSPTSLSSLAYGGFGSSDISPVSDTARLALEKWRRC